MLFVWLIANVLLNIVFDEYNWKLESQLIDMIFYISLLEV